MKSKKIKFSLKKERRSFYLFIFLICFILFLSLFLLINLFNYYNNNIIEKKEIYTEVEIGDKVGVAINGSALIFGRIKPNGISTKEINLVNNYDNDVLVEIVKEGNISDFISVSENNFVLKKMESKNVSFIAISDKDPEYGKYSGYVYVIIRRL